MTRATSWPGWARSSGCCRVPKLPIGTWRLLSESLETETQPARPLAVSQPFTVEPCGTACDPALAQSIVTEFKATTLASYKIYYDACVAYAVHGALTAARSTAADVNSIVNDAYSGEILQRAVVDKLKEAELGEWNFGSGRLVFSMAGASLTVVPLDDTARMAEEKAKEILHTLVCVLGSAYADIANDPPDDDYATAEEAAVRGVVPLGDAVSDRLADGLDRQIGTAYAALAGLEKYQGAQIDGNTTGVHRQAAGLAVHTFQLADQLRRAARDLKAYADHLDSVPAFDEPVFPDVAAKDGAQQVLSRIARDGFTQAETDNLVELGLDEDQIGRLRSRLDLDLSGLTAGTTLQDVARGVAVRLASQRADYLRFATEAEAVASATDAPPEAGMEVSYLGARDFEFTSTSTSADGDQATSIEWDFGDGERAAGANVAHTYDAAGTHTARVTVCDLYGCDTATELVEVGPGTPPPVATFSIDEPRTEGRPLTLDSTTSRADQGSIVRRDWSFGDGQSFDRGGTVVSHTYVQDGTYVARLKVTDSLGASSTATREIVVANVAPTMTPDIPVRVPVGRSRPYEVRVSDPGVEDDPVVTWDFGDGTRVTSNPTFTTSRVDHTYASEGQYALTVTVDDGDGGVTRQEVTVVVGPPTADAGPDCKGSRGRPCGSGGDQAVRRRTAATPPTCGGSVMGPASRAGWSSTPTPTTAPTRRGWRCQKSTSQAPW